MRLTFRVLSAARRHASDDRSSVAVTTRASMSLLDEEAKSYVWEQTAAADASVP
jgi:hypothetical protein